MIDNLAESAENGTASKRNSRPTDNSKFFTPAQVAARWGWHVESVRRAIRQRRIAVTVIGRRLLIPIAEIEKIEAQNSLGRQP